MQPYWECEFFKKHEIFFIAFNGIVYLYRENASKNYEDKTLFE